MDKRQFLKVAGATSLVSTAPSLLAAQSDTPKTSSKTTLPHVELDVPPITIDERKSRIKKAQRLMGKYNIDALVIEPGPAMDYFTGIKWWRSERLVCVVVPREGEIAVVAPFFEKPSIQETLFLGDDIRVWQEDESPFTRVKQVLQDRGIKQGKVGFETSVRYFVLDGIMSALPNFQHTSAAPVTEGCRMYKTTHELQLMHKASEITLRAYEYTYSQLKLGMSQVELKAIMKNAMTQMGGGRAWSMALFNEASAYPHGTKQPQKIREGSVVLMDAGCDVHGYKSDISRTFVFGEPNAKQRKVWNTARKGQDVAFAAMQLGKPAGSIDDAVRKYYESVGFGPDYKLPGLSHRTGHGIGMEGHEEVNFVRGETEVLAPGMCFSNEPGIYLPGEFGVRLEDCIYMGQSKAHYFTMPAESIEKPLGALAPKPT